MQFIMKDPYDIKINPFNPRLVKADQFNRLVQSLREAPWMLHIRPIVIDVEGIAIGGNQRVLAARIAGLKSIPTLLVVSLTDAQKKEFIIKDNLSSGEWDWDRLKVEYEVDKLEEWGLQFLLDEIETEILKATVKTEKFQLLIDCVDGEQQRALHEHLLAQGFNAKIKS